MDDQIVRFRILGSVRLEKPDGTDVGSVLRGPKRLALLTYLALEASRGFQRRDAIVALLWPELDQTRARHALRNTLHHVRQGVGDGVVTNRGADEVGIDHGRLWCDVTALERAIREGRDERALELHRGELLPGFHVPDALGFERWLDVRRQAIRRLALEAALRDAERRERAGDTAGAVGRLRQALALDPLDEGIVRRLIRLLSGLGRRLDALRAYEEVVARLRTELELDPSEETRCLAAAVRTGRSPGPPESVSTPAMVG